MTRKEFVILSMGMISVFCLYRMHGGWWWKYFVLLYAWGLLFETVTQNLWSYSPQLTHSRFTIPKTGINLVLPFGWMFLATVSDWLAIRLIDYIMWTGIIGTTMEICFLNLGYWKYNADQKFMGLYRPFQPHFTILGVPWQIIPSYFFCIGAVNYLFMERMFR